MQQFNNNSTEDTVSKGLGFLVPGYPFMDPWVCRWFSVWAKKKSRLSDVAAIFLPSCLRCKRANWKKKKKKDTPANSPSVATSYWNNASWALVK